MTVEAGRVLNQRYRLIRPVGQGSQASVWVAEHLALQTHVAVKLISQELAKKDSARERFRREATAAAQLRSAHVVQILDHGIDGDQPFIVMELLDGEDLFERLAHRTRLSLRETSKIVTQVARALARAHAAGIVHRDLKPENVFLCPNEDEEVVKVLDFGVAKVKDAAKVTMQKTGVGTLIGTPHYMSPEQVKGIGEIDYHTDLWGLGVIAFQCVTGDLPYDSEGVGDLLIKITIGDAPIPSKVYPSLPTAFDTWFAKACAREPKNRFQSAREMAVALAAIVNQTEGVQPRSPTVRPPAATLPGITAIPKAPRAVTQQLDIGEWEEVEPFDEDDEDDAPTRMKPPADLPPGHAPPGFLPASPAASQPAAPKPKAEPGVAPRPGTAPRPTADAKPAPKPIATKPSADLAPKPAVAKKATPPAVEPKRSEPPQQQAHAPLTVSTPAPPPRELDGTDSHDIVDFDETIPATEAMMAPRPSIAVPLVVRANASGAQPNPFTSDAQPPLAPLSEPPRSRESEAPAPVMPAASSLPSGGMESKRIAPVVMPPPRPAVAPPPGPDAVPPSIPKAPPPSSRAVASPRPSPTPVVRPVDPVNAGQRALQTEPPPELDGSRRRRMVRFLVAGLVIAALGLTWTVVRSQIDLSSGTPTPPSATTSVAPPPPPPPPPDPQPTTTSTGGAVDPGKVSHPSKPQTTSTGKAPVKQRPRKPPSDGEVVVPDPGDDAVPAAP